MSKDILFISTNLYDSFPSRKPRFAHFLAGKGFRVLYVEPPFTLLALLRKDFRRNIKPGIRKESDNFFILNAFPWLPFFKKSGLVNLIDNYIFLYFLKRGMSHINFKPTIVVNYMPFIPFALKRLSAKIIYDCVDDHSAFGGLISPAFVNKLERKTVEISDIVIVTGNERLREKLEKYGKKPIVIENGVDWDLFAKGLSSKKQVEVKRQIVYVGAISEWFDTELVKRIALEFGEFTIILIGKQSINLGEVESLKNVLLTGKLDQKEIAPILRESSAGIIPFKISTLTEKIDPLKAYEYLAAGIPVVSTNVGNVHSLPVAVADSHDDFIEKLTEVIATDSTEKRIERSRIAKRFSWDAKCKLLDSIINNLLQGN